MCVSYRLGQHGQQRRPCSVMFPNMTESHINSIKHSRLSSCSAGLSVAVENVPVASWRPLSGAHQDGGVWASGQPAGGSAGPGAPPQQTQHHQGEERAHGHVSVWTPQTCRQIGGLLIQVSSAASSVRVSNLLIKPQWGLVSNPVQATVWESGQWFLTAGHFIRYSSSNSGCWW